MSQTTVVDVPVEHQERPTVTFVAHAIHDGGGMERCFAELIRFLHDRYRIVVVAQDLAPELRGLAEWQPVRVPSRPALLRFVCFYALAGWLLRRSRPGLVYTLGAIVPNHVDVAALHFCHIAYRTRTGRLAPAGGARLRRLNAIANRLVAVVAERWSYRPGRVRLLAAVSPGVAQEARRHFGGVPVEVVPDGVDLNRFRANPEVRRSLRYRERIDEREIVALFMGGDWERKGLPIVVEALALLPPALVGRVRLWVVGSGDTRRIARLARSLGIESRISVFDHTSKPEEFLAAADLLVLPSEYETFSLVAYEAAATGIPVAAAAVSGVADLIGRDEAGILVERSPASMAAAIARIASDDELRLAMGERARERVSPFTWDAAGEALDRVFERLLGGVHAGW